jgi:hypothetical protein
MNELKNTNKYKTLQGALTVLDKFVNTPGTFNSKHHSQFLKIRNSVAVLLNDVKNLDGNNNA